MTATQRLASQIVNSKLDPLLRVQRATTYNYAEYIPSAKWPKAIKRLVRQMTQADQREREAKTAINALGYDIQVGAGYANLSICHATRAEERKKERAQLAESIAKLSTLKTNVLIELLPLSNKQAQPVLTALAEQVNSL